ncbi:hypothetical protein MRS44_008443 [Fusarium solani]|uniref:uncharacterized protein n=1 Tax=Fusarium solani TaxID=169388 RepID=UPI0032C45870|nr:hypothetical protein MRS44_008443 [Fusarium solani]
MDPSEAEVPRSPSANVASVPSATPRRSLKRNSAACERCRRRKQKVHPHPALLSLKQRVHDLEGQLETLRAERSNESRGCPEPSQDFFQEHGTSVVDHDDHVYRGRILRPTFSGSALGSILEPALRGSPWQLWADDQDSQSSPRPVDPIGSLPAAQSEGLVDIFFTNRWPQLPVLHKPSFIENDFLPLTRGELGRPLSPFRVYMVLAIASAEAKNSREVQQQHNSHESFFQTAIGDLDLVLGADDLDCVQCLLLLCLYGTNEPQSVNMWYTLGLALRIGLGIDLHREESSNASQGLLSQQMTRRLFWCIYTMDRSMSIAMGRPLGINDSDITVPFPLQLTDEQLCHPEAAPNIAQDPRDMSTFLHVIKLRQINAAIYVSLHAASGNTIKDYDSLDAVRQAHYTNLNTWLVTAPRYGPSSRLAMLQAAEWFQIAYHYAVLSLYRPSRVFPVGTISALRLCADSAISLISCYNTLYAKNRISYTFVALNSLFMAAVTMLHSLRSSPVIRSELSKSIAEANIEMCQRLLRGVSNGRSVGERCAVIVGRLGKATLDVFDRPSSSDDEVDGEFMSWFGLKLQPSGPGQVPGHEIGQQLTPSIDMPWNDLLVEGFNIGSFNQLDFIV